MCVGGSDPQKPLVPLKSAFMFSIQQPETVENLVEPRIRRECCTLALLGNEKVLVAGGGYTQQEQYQQGTELYDLQKDIWKPGGSGNLKFNRLSPFLVSLGSHSALVIGGY